MNKNQTNFGAEFRKLRKEKKMRLVFVAHKVGVTTRTLISWEHKPNYNISLSTVQKCFKLVGYEVGILPVCPD